MIQLISQINNAAKIVFGKNSMRGRATKTAITSIVTPIVTGVVICSTKIGSARFVFFVSFIVFCFLCFGYRLG